MRKKYIFIVKNLNQQMKKKKVLEKWFREKNLFHLKI